LIAQKIGGLQYLVNKIFISELILTYCMKSRPCAACLNLKVIYTTGRVDFLLKMWGAINILNVTLNR